MVTRLGKWLFAHGTACLLVVKGHMMRWTIDSDGQIEVLVMQCLPCNTGYIDSLGWARPQPFPAQHAL